MSDQNRRLLKVCALIYTVMLLTVFGFQSMGRSDYFLYPASLAGIGALYVAGIGYALKREKLVLLGIIMMTTYAGAWCGYWLAILVWI